MTHAEFLRSQGATEADISTLDTPVARKGYEALQTQLAEAESVKAAAETTLNANKEWHAKAKPEYDRMQSEYLKAKSEAARLDALVRAGGDQGLIDLAKEAGHEVAPPPAAPAGFDPKNYMTLDMMKELSKGAGYGLADMQDIVDEHRQLFPKNPLRMANLYKEAEQAGKDVHSYWLEKYKVSDARAAQSAKSQQDHDDVIRKEATDKLRAEYAEQGNPALRTPSSSRSVFATRQADGSAVGKQPWERDGDSKEKRHLQRSDEAIKHVLNPQAN